MSEESDKIQRLVAAAWATLMEQRREFARGEVEDLDKLEDALTAMLPGQQRFNKT